MDLEDRIRQIRAKNDEIRRRQLEVEADRLKYARKKKRNSRPVMQMLLDHQSSPLSLSVSIHLWQ